MKFLHYIRYFFNKKEKEFIKKLKLITGILPNDPLIFKIAFTHSSLSKKNANGTSEVECNERLEYLGDAVLGFVVAEYLFKKYPKKDEGFLTEMRSKIVSRNTLNEIALKIGIDSLIQYDAKNIGSNQSILGNALEALIGAIYLDQGFVAAKNYIYKTIINGHIDVNELEKTDYNFKSKLLEFAQKKKTEPISYELIAEENRGSHKVFTVGVKLGKKIISQATDTKKKNAEQKASELALAELKKLYP